MQALKEYIIEAIAADDAKCIRRLAKHKTPDLDFYIPEILRACRDLEIICGQDNAHAQHSQAQLEVMSALALIINPADILTKSSNMHIHPNLKLQEELIDKIELTPKLADKIYDHVRQAKLNGVLTIPVQKALYFYFKNTKDNNI